jgi:hypothetical protein
VRERGCYVVGLGKRPALFAAGKLADAHAEEDCEGGALGNFFHRTNTAGCDPCTNRPGFRGGLSLLVEEKLDAANSLVYCASPSGAFVQ